jgi:hypothetical protein
MPKLDRCERQAQTHLLNCLNLIRGKKSLVPFLPLFTLHRSSKGLNLQKFQSAPDQQRPPPKHYQKRDPKREQVNAAWRSGRIYARPPTVEMQEQQQQSQQPNDSERTVVIERGKSMISWDTWKNTQARIPILE